MNKDKYEHFNIGINDSSKRLDNIIRRFLPKLTLQNIFKSIRSGDIRINGLKVKQNYKVVEGDILYIYKPLLENIKKEKLDNKLQLNKSRIIFENNYILIYNKPAGELVHGEKNSLNKKIKVYLKDKIVDNLSFTPGPLHRLDRNTQGLVVFSVSLTGARTFTKLLQNNLIQKNYLTIVDGVHKNTELWEDRIDRDERTLKSFSSGTGKIAKSKFKPLISKNNKTLALVTIETGRTHQIRVQASIHKKPITGDKKYGSNATNKDYFLSAISLTFTENSDILNKGTFSIPIKSLKNSILNEMFCGNELTNLESIIKKGLTN